MCFFFTNKLFKQYIIYILIHNYSNFYRQYVTVFGFVGH